MEIEILGHYICDQLFHKGNPNLQVHKIDLNNIVFLQPNIKSIRI